MSKNNCCKNSKNERLGQVGGQAVLEGVMMRAGNTIALSVRTLSGNIKTDVEVLPEKKSAVSKIPLVRGIVNFVTMMKLSISTLNKSVDMLGLEEEEPSKFEKWLEKHFGKSLTSVVTAIGTVLGFALSILLFMFIPKEVSNLIFGDSTGWWMLLESAVSGILRIFIFLAYIWGVAFMPDIKKTFQYHGAEHKSVFCHEKNLELTVENVMKQSRYHPRCGTSFLVIMMIIGIIIGLPLVNIQNMFLRLGVSLLTLPLVVGVGYEFIRFAGKHDNFLTRALSAPGLWIQRLTTKEPTKDQIEVAIISLKASLPDIYPEISDILEAQKESENGNGETEAETNTVAENTNEEKAQ
ncbi:MAG: DUF1385 domain-containing protein [Ruminococcaceae bacterium]|nr:DUF1385 domain-containing protein [Oscillospiraceae bacterium]